ncbi:HAD family hydrolase [bacterium]|nr:MAG: HAD family hydrolase [bacterium]
MSLALAFGVEVDAVGFDLDHTLGFDDRLELRTLLRYARRAAATRGVTLAAPVREQASVLLARARAGELTVDRAVALFLTDYLSVREAEQQAARWRDEVVAEARVAMRPAPGARACVERLEARGLPVAILTNGWSPLQEAKAESLGLGHLPLLISEHIGALKPAPEAFAALVARLGTSPARTAYVGDDLDTDVLGARAAALVPVWVPEREPRLDDVCTVPGDVIRLRTITELAP